MNDEAVIAGGALFVSVIIYFAGDRGGARRERSRDSTRRQVAVRVFVSVAVRTSERLKRQLDALDESIRAGVVRHYFLAAGPLLSREDEDELRQSRVARGEFPECSEAWREAIDHTLGLHGHHEELRKKAALSDADRTSQASESYRRDLTNAARSLASALQLSVGVAAADSQALITSLQAKN